MDTNTQTQAEQRVDTSVKDFWTKNNAFYQGQKNIVTGWIDKSYKMQGVFFSDIHTGSLSGLKK